LAFKFASKATVRFFISTSWYQQSW